MNLRIPIRRDSGSATEDGSDRKKQSDNTLAILLPKELETSARERYVLPPRVNLRKIVNVESS
jgi:hypothetical protein